MQWRVLTAVALILALLAGGMICRGAVADSCGAVEAMLRQAKASPAPESLERARALWESRLPLLSCVLTHDRLERVGEGLARAAGCLQAGDAAAFAAQIESLLYLLDDIREYDHINAQTLL